MFKFYVITLAYSSTRATSQIIKSTQRCINSLEKFNYDYEIIKAVHPGNYIQKYNEWGGWIFDDISLAKHFDNGHTLSKWGGALNYVKVRKSISTSHHIARQKLIADNNIGVIIESDCYVVRPLEEDLPYNHKVINLHHEANGSVAAMSMTPELARYTDNMYNALGCFRPIGHMAHREYWQKVRLSPYVYRPEKAVVSGNEVEYSSCHWYTK